MIYMLTQFSRQQLQCVTIELFALANLSQLPMTTGEMLDACLSILLLNIINAKCFRFYTGLFTTVEEFTF